MNYLNQKGNFNYQFRVGSILFCLLLALVIGIRRADLLRHNLTFRSIAVAAQAGDVQPMTALLADNSLPRQRVDMLAWGAGRVLEAHGDQEQAAVLWQQMAPDTQGQLDIWLLSEANAYENAGKNQAAEDTLGLRTAFMPSDWRTYVHLAEFLQRESRQEDAATVFAAGGQVVTGSAGDYLSGRAAETLRNWEAARDLFARAASGDPEIAGQALYRLAIVLQQRFDDDAGAISACTLAIEQMPSFYACYELLGLLYTKFEDYEQAALWYNAGITAIASESYQSLFLRRLGELALTQNKMDEAENSFRGALVLKISDADAHRGLARTLAGRGDFAGAVTSQQAAIQWRTQRSAPAQWYAELGQFHRQVGDLQAALAAFKAALAGDAANTAALQGINELEQLGITQ